MHVILQYVLLEWKLSFGQEFKIEKMAVSVCLFVF